MLVALNLAPIMPPKQSNKIKTINSISVPRVKKVVYPLRLTSEMHNKIKKIAKQNKTDCGKVIRALLEEQLSNYN